MKNIVMLISVFSLLAACKKETKKEADAQAEQKEIAYQAFGNKIVPEGALTVSELSQRYSNLKLGDTIPVKFKGKISEVCQKKGCWMTVPLDGGQTTMIRFKGYGFFMPLNAGNREAVVEGVAFVRETPVEELKHYAKDAGKSEAEISKITEPKREFAFVASGVLIRE
jgi:Domain of unknown function (DUF4920)